MLMNMVNGAAALTLTGMVNADNFNRMRPLTIPTHLENSLYRSTALPVKTLPPERGTPAAKLSICAETLGTSLRRFHALRCIVTHRERA